MNATEYIESGKRNWKVFSRLAEADGYDFVFELVKGWNRMFFYIAASDGKTTWVVQEPNNPLFVNETVVTKMNIFSPLYKKTATQEVEEEEDLSPHVIEVSAESFEKYGAILEGRPTWKNLSDVTAISVYKLPNGTFVKA